MNILHLIQLLMFIEVISSAPPNNAKVRTRLGKIEGFSKQLNTGKVVDAFLGIPYALPPIGENRFSPAQPVTRWNGTLNAKIKSPSCWQGSSEEEKQSLWFVTNATESEDCLYLNIWRPSNAKRDKMAVMVWIHGGGLFTGSSVMPLYDGSILATEENILVVSLNYRLSILAQLYLDIPEVPGNLVLQDQMLALKWIQQNIESFGGDRKKVTLFGESGGAIAIGYHLTNPSAFPLFRNAILQSGSPNNGLVALAPEKMFNVSVELARSLGCPYVETEKNVTLNCLRGKNVSEIMAPFQYFPDYFNFRGGQIRNGKEVCSSPQTCALEIPDNLRKPLLIGTIQDEFNCFQKFLFPGKLYDENTTITEQEWKNIINLLYMLQDDRLIKQTMEIYQESKDYNTAQVRLETGRFFSDSAMNCPSIGFTEQYASSSSNTYMFYYTHRLSKPRTPMPLWAGTLHGDEIPYIFGAPVDPENKFTAEEVLFSKKVMAYWAQFARTSDPNGDNPKRDFWPKYDNNKKTYLSLGLTSYPLTDLKRRECFFWDNTFPMLVSLQMDLNKLNTRTCP